MVRVEMISFRTPEDEAAYRERQRLDMEERMLREEIANAEQLDRIANLRRQAAAARRNRRVWA